MKSFFAIKLCLLITVANVAIFIAMWVQSGFGDLNNLQLLDWGANFAPFTLTGEPWRLLSSAFLHGGWMHLLLNMYMLLLLGSVIERVVGSWRFGSIYLLSALGGSLLSAFWYGYHEVSSFQFVFGTVVPTGGIRPVVSMGASGAIMGLAGAACAMVLCYQQSGWPREASVRISGKAILQVVAINLVYGLMEKGIDQAAHIGGLIVGFIAGMIMCWGENPAAISSLRRVALPLLYAILGSSLMVFVAMQGSSGELLEWKASVAEQQAQRAAKNGDADDDDARDSVMPGLARPRTNTP